MSKMKSLAEYELAESDLDVVSGGRGCGQVERNHHGRGRSGAGRGNANIGLINQGSVGGNIIAIAGDVVVNGSGSITIVGGNLISS